MRWFYWNVMRFIGWRRFIRCCDIVRLLFIRCARIMRYSRIIRQRKSLRVFRFHYYRCCVFSNVVQCFDCRLIRIILISDCSLLVSSIIAWCGTLCSWRRFWRLWNSSWFVSCRVAPYLRVCIHITWCGYLMLIFVSFENACGCYSLCNSPW